MGRGGGYFILCDKISLNVHAPETMMRHDY